ncbi:hypothetical protein P7C73_g5998, partial [Tremellales sp. Uapishka_1]
MEAPTEYTHIVVGAGSAGCIVARRIAENKMFHVLLVEAGPDVGPLDHSPPLGVRNARRVPMKGQSEVFDDEIDWSVSVEVPGAEPMVIPQAKLVGGGSSINGGTALRHTYADSKEWIELGNDAWDFESTSRVYASLEGDEVRGTTGPHPIVRTSLDDAGPIQQAFVLGAEDCGFQLVLDLNAEGSEGVGPSPVCRKGDIRISAANTFIDPVREWTNLTIIAKSHVDKLILRDQRAVGVSLVDGRTIFSTHEVILSAGAIFSPAILQRSGIGPSALLKSLNIPVQIDLPVGIHLSDHPCIPIVARPLPGSYSPNDYSLQMQARWSSTTHPGAIDLQMVCFSYLYAPAPDAALQIGKRALGGTETGHLGGVGCNVNKGTSSGTIKIRSTDPSESPLVSPNYLSTNADRLVARELIRTAYAVMTSAPMQRKLGSPIGLDDNIINSDELLDRYVQAQYSSTYHFCCSCRMASREKGGVVDQSGRVYDIGNLRVCDASVIPTVPAANTMWTTMMFAERIGCSLRDGKDVEAI